MVFKIEIQAMRVKHETYKSGQISEEDYKNLLIAKNNQIKGWGARINVFNVEALLQK
jgi:hypothetical protein